MTFTLQFLYSFNIFPIKDHASQNESGRLMGEEAVTDEMNRQEGRIRSESGSGMIGVLGCEENF